MATSITESAIPRNFRLERERLRGASGTAHAERSVVGSVLGCQTAPSPASPPPRLGRNTPSRLRTFHPAPPGRTAPVTSEGSGRMPMVGVESRCCATATDAGTASNAGDLEPDRGLTEPAGAGTGAEVFSVRGSGAVPG